MKHLFIVNPASGHGSASEAVYGSLSSLPSDIDSEIYIIKGKGDGERYIKKTLSSSGEPVRCYACGGDGTVSEVVNGIAMFPHASFTVFPCGSGNDFVKSVGGEEIYKSLPALTAAVEMPIDFMRVNDRYCVNVCHFGFDSYVAAKMNEVRSRPVIGGGNAYTTGVALGLLHAMKSRAVITADGDTMCSGDFLLCTVANGQYVGGKYRCAPQSSVTDGLLDICVASPVSRLTFIRLVKYYADGSHLTDPRFRDFLHYRRCARVTIDAEDGFCISLDGEVVPMSHAVIDILPKGIKLAVPRGAKII